MRNDKQTRKLIRKRNRRRARRDRAKAKGWHKAVKRHNKAIRKLNGLIRVRQRQRVIPREDWGAQPPRGAYTPQYSIGAGVQHHTAAPTLPADASPSQEAERMRLLQQIHFGNGWTDLGYAYVVFPSGRIYEGRPAQYVGAHTLGHNTGYAGWALDGNYEVDKPTKAAVASCRFVRRKLFKIGDKPLYGHYELNPTSCPGRNLKPHLKENI